MTRFSYDGNGNVTARRTYVTRIDMTKWVVGTEPAVVANDQRDGMLRTVYDALNRLVFTVDGNGDAVEMKYDSVGNVLERIAYANKIPVTTAATISAMRAALDAVADAGRDVHVRNAYDSANRLQWSVDSLGQVTGFSYDIDGNLAKQVVYAQRVAAGANPSGVVAGEGDRVTLSSYDSANRLVLRVDEHGMATALEYDANSNVVKSTAFARPLVRPTAASAAPITAPAADAAHDHVVRKVYDILNREIYSIDSIGAVTETRYDGNGHAIEKIAYASPIPLATAANTAAVAAALSSVADANRDVRLRYAYDLDGRLQWSADATGAVTGYAYNNLGEVVRRTVYAARFAPALGADFAAGINAAAVAGASAGLDDGTVRVYDKNGSLTWEMDATGGVIQYRYDGKGNQVEKIVYATRLDPTKYVTGSDIVAPAANAQDVHQYQVFDAAGQLSWSIDGMGGATNFTYDGEGNVVSRVTYATPIDISKWVVGSDPAVVSDPARDNVTRTVYDAARRPLFTIDGMGQVTGVKYDGNGNVVESRIYAKRIPLVTAATLVAVQGALVADDANDLRTQKVFDADNRLVMESDSKGLVTAYSHDSFGNVVKTISYTTPLATGADIHSVHAAANDRVSLVNYDADSRIVSTVDPTGQVTKYEYDANGHKVKTTVFGNRVARPTAISSPALADSVQANAGKDLVAQSVFDGAGNEIFSIGHTGLLTARKFDSHGNVIESITYHKPVDSSVNASKESLSALAAANADAANDLRTRYVYDNSGREIWSVDQAGTAIKHIYNGAGLVSETNTFTRVSPSVELTATALQAALTNPANRYTWTYDAAGRVESTTCAFDRPFDFDFTGSANVTRYAYDGIGNETGRKVSNVYDGTTHNSVLHTVYDAQNRAVYTLDISGNVVAFKYDLRGNVVEKTAFATRVSTASLFTSRVIDDYFGFLGDAAAGTANIAFDSATSAANIGAAVAAVADASRDVVSRRVFDQSGRLLWDVSSAGLVTGFTYDVEGHVVKQVQYATVLANNAAPQLVAASPIDQVQLFAYDSEGRQVLHVDQDGYVTRQAYDADSNVTETLRYTNRTARPTAESTAPQAGTLPVAVDAQRDDWSRSVYDAAGRQVFSLNSKGELSQWTYDGNVVRQTIFAKTIDPATPATMAALSAAAAAISDHAKDGQLSQVFDANGRVIANTNAYGGTTRYRYGSDGRLIETVVPDGEPSLQGYDLNGQVVFSRDSSNREKMFFYDASHNLVRTQSTGRLPDPDWRLDARDSTDIVKGMVYDAAGRVIWTSVGLPSPYEASAVRYDAHGNVIESVRYADTKGLYEASPLPVNGLPYNEMRPIVDLSRAAASRLAAGGKASFDLRTRNVYNDKNQLVYSEQGGIVTAFSYDDQGNVIRKVQSASKIVPGSEPSSVPVSAEDRITLMAYDADHHLILQVNPDGAVTSQSFDAYGNKLKHAEYMATVGDVAALAAAWADPAVRAKLPVATSAGDRISHYAYDSQDRLVYSVDMTGAVKRTEYDAHGNVSAEILFEEHVTVRGGAGFADYSLGGLEALFKVAAPRDHTSSYTYDALGQMRSATDSMGATDFTTYGANGRRNTFTDKEGNVWEYKYDGEGRLWMEIGPALPAQGGGTYRSVTEYVYDGNGNMVERKISGSNGNLDSSSVRYVYDYAGRASGTETPESLYWNGTAWASTAVQKGPRYNALGQVHSTSTEMGGGIRRFYDESGLLKYELDYYGGVTAYKRNVFGDELEMTRYAAAVPKEMLANFTSMDTPALDQIVAGLDRTGARTISNTVDRAGRVIESQAPEAFVYDPTAPAGQQYYKAGIKTVRDYDTFGNLLSTATINPVTGEKTVEASWYDIDGKLKATVSNAGFMTVYKYDDFGNKVSVTESATAIAGWKGDYEPMPAAQEAAHDRITTYEYDEAQRITKETLNDRAHLATANSGYVKTSQYDKKGNVVIANSWGPGQTGSNSPTIMTYDGMGHVIAVLDGMRPNGEGFALTVNFYGPGGHVVETVQYEKGVLVEGKTVAVDPNSPATRRTRIDNDYAGRPVRIFDAAGITHEVLYDAGGNKAREQATGAINNGNAPSNWAYDLLGRLTSDSDQGVTLKYNAFGDLIYKKQGEQEYSYDYDDAGHLWRSNEAGVTQVFLNDLRGQRTAMMVSAGSFNGNRDLSLAASAEELAQAGDVRRTDFYYDSEGRCIREVQPVRQGQRPESIKVFDHWGNLLQDTQPVVAGKPAPTVTYTYDLKSRKLSESHTKADGTAGGRVREFSYVFGERGMVVMRQTTDRENAAVAGPQDNDSLHARYRETVENYNIAGQLLSTIVNGVKAEEHTYDVFGQLRSDIIGGRVVCNYDYNGIGQLVKESHPVVDNWRFDLASHSTLNDGQRAMSKTFAYDNRGNLASITTGTGVVTKYTHDEQGNLTSSTDALNNTSYTTWDKSGHKKTTKDALNYTVINEYDKLGHLKKVIGADGSITINEYDNAGLLVRSTQASKGQTVDYTYDDAGQVATIHELVTGMSAAANTNRWTYYAYDAVGNRISEVQEQNGLTFQRNVLVYDAEHRLVGVDVADLGTGSQFVRMEFDGFGNRSRFNSWSSSSGPGRNQDGYFFYDALNRIVRADATNASGAVDESTTDYVYDVDGNLGRKTQGGGATQTFTYDAMNRLVASVIGGQQYNTRYDSAGRVVEEWTKVEEMPDVQADVAPVAPIEPKRPVDPGPNAPQADKDRYQALLTQYNIDYTAYQKALADYAEQQAEYGDQVSFLSRLVRSKAKTGYERHAMSYDVAGRTLVTEGYNDDGSVKFRQTNDKFDAAGNVLKSTSFSTVGDDMSQFYTSTYGAGSTGAVLQWSEGYMRGESGKLAGRTGATAKSVMVYNADGKMIAVNFEEPASGDSPKSGPKSKFFVFDAQGNILKATEVDKNAPIQEQYQVIANGQLQMRYSTNSGGFGGDMSGEQKDNFWRAYNLNASQNPLIDDPVAGGSTPGNGGNVVVANDGDTLQTIAQRIYGDASLWYKLAEANKLEPGQALHGGQALTAPAYKSGVSLEQTYNNGKLVGSTMPNLPSPPPPKSKWGFIAKIVSIIVFVVVVYFTGNVALAAAAGSLAEQHTTNMLNGNFDFKRFVKRTLNPFSGNLQDFMRTFYDPLGNGDHEYMDYKAVAKAGAMAYVSQGIGSYVSSAVGGAVSQGATALGAAPGMATAIGTQVGAFASAALTTALTSEHFSWKAVAASYVSQKAGNFVGEQVGSYIGESGTVLSGSWGKYAQLAVSSAAQNISYQVIKNNRVDWKAVGVSTLATVGNALINNNIDTLGGEGSFGAYAARGVLGGYLSERRGGNFIDGLVDGVGSQIKSDVAESYGNDNLTNRFESFISQGIDSAANALTEFANSFTGNDHASGKRDIPALTAIEDEALDLPNLSVANVLGGGGRLADGASRQNELTIWSGTGWTSHQSLAGVNDNEAYFGQDGLATNAGPQENSHEVVVGQWSNGRDDTDANRVQAYASADYRGRYSGGKPAIVKFNGQEDVACWLANNNCYLPPGQAALIGEAVNKEAKEPPMQIVTVSGKEALAALNAKEGIKALPTPSFAAISQSAPPLTLTEILDAAPVGQIYLKNTPILKQIEDDQCSIVAYGSNAWLDKATPAQREAYAKAQPGPKLVATDTPEFAAAEYEKLRSRNKLESALLGGFAYGEIGRLFGADEYQIAAMNRSGSVVFEGGAAVVAVPSGRSNIGRAPKEQNWSPRENGSFYGSRRYAGKTPDYGTLQTKVPGQLNGAGSPAFSSGTGAYSQATSRPGINSVKPQQFVAQQGNVPIEVLGTPVTFAVGEHNKVLTRGSSANPNVQREFTTVIKHQTGNRQVLIEGQRWNLPRDMDLSAIPMNDPVGAKLQQVTDAAANSWNPRRHLSANERANIAKARKADEYWRANLAEQQAKGRWIENQVRDNADIANMNLQWSRRGVDVVDPATGLSYDIMSGTKTNMNDHSKRMPDVLFRMITF
ncbi:hypothetical protein [Duganella sp. CF458]|uniref:hypothetical protein n=1 Tax=Duganella sp. CF458 TaxID=1884368 RepID=UPI001B8BBDD9|nr:hypothetical protein [Duganella sp. CF458]